MFEDKTFENILNSMLSRVPNDIDKREGSIIYDAIAPAAYELAQAYFLLEQYLKLPFIDTSEGIYLTQICAQFGVMRKAAIPAVKTGEFRNSSGELMDIPLGSRFGLNGLVYTASEKISTGIFKMTCETAGSTGNIPSGALLPIDNISGLASAILSVDALIAGSDTETDDALRQRALVKIQLPSTSGSVNDYRMWALNINGVGGVKVFELWNGPGTVKVVLIGSDKKAAGSDVVAAAAEYIESVRPIGANVTVEAAKEVNIDITVTVSMASGYTSEQVTENIMTAVRAYLQSIAFIQDAVSYARIGNAILETPGVIDYSGLQVNGGISNILISSTAEDCQTPVIGMVNIS